MIFRQKSETRKHFGIRLTSEEHAQIKARAQEVGMSTSEYIRRRALSQKLKQPTNGAIIEELSRLGRQQKTLCLGDMKNEPVYRALLQQISNTIVAIPYRIRAKKT